MSVTDEANVANALPETESVAPPRPRSMLPLLIIALVLAGGFFFGRNFLANAQVTGEEQARTAMRKFLQRGFRFQGGDAVAKGVGSEEAQRQAEEFMKKYKGLAGTRHLKVNSVGLFGNSAEGQAMGEFNAGHNILLMKTQGDKVVEITEKPGSFSTERSARPSLSAG